MESVVKEALKSLCCGYGWSYGAIWLFDQQNPMFLTLAEAYEDRIRGLCLIDDLLLQVHILGQGIIGEAAFTGKEQWIRSEALDESLIGSVSCEDNEVGAELRAQLALGIKTIVAIPLESYGVVQFGSTKKMADNLEFLEETKKVFLENINIRHTNASMPLLFENYGSDEWFDLLFSNEMSSCNNQVLRSSSASDKLTEVIYDSVNMSHSQASVSEMVSLEQLFPSEKTDSSPFIFPPFQQEMEDQQDDVMKLDTLEVSTWPAALSNQCPDAQLYSIPHDLLVVSKDAFSKPSRVSTSSSLNQFDMETPVYNQSHSVQGDNMNTFSHYIQAKGSDQFACFTTDFDDRKGVPPHLQSSQMVGSCVSGISELDTICGSRPRKGLFSELGLEQLLSENVQNSASVDRSGFADPYSTSKRRKVGCGSTSVSQSQCEVVSCLSDKISSFQQNHQEVTKMENLGFESDFMLKPQAGLWIDNNCSINDGSTSATKIHATRTQENTKHVKKRARPGESTRPRPKDRQQFQDRLGELRKMIPNTGKCSIDGLLDCTIKHMLFLQNVTKYAEKLKQIADHKEKGSISKNNANGVTWAFEICNQTMMCPIKVEDVGSSGQMLIEMLCENGATFLEIADTIRGFGLCILNGSMEDRDDKTWAHFIVEAKANSSVTRVDVFWSLAQHLQQSTKTSGINSISQLPIKPADNTPVPQSDCTHQPLLSQPILTDALR